MREEIFFCFLGYGEKKRKMGSLHSLFYFHGYINVGVWYMGGGLNNGNGYDIMFGFVCMKK